MSITKTITLIDDTEYTPLPDTRDTILMGPGKLSITRRDDGKVHGRILEGKPMPFVLVGKRNLKRVAWGI
jgi:hypothetical protein